MNKKWFIFFAVILVLMLVSFFIKDKLLGKPGPAALSISSTPKATVFIDGNQAGNTPFLNEKLPAGEHMIKLIPQETKETLVSWEGKVNLYSDIMTVINRVLGQSDSTSAGETIWLEKISSKDKSSLAVISVPDQAVFRLDGEPKGFTPSLQEELNPGSYQVTVASAGYEERSIPAKTVAGFKLVINIQLAKKIEDIQEATTAAQPTQSEAKPTPKPTPTSKPSPTLKPSATISSKPTAKPSGAILEKPYVLIKETPTGWLRVRMEPSTTATEAAKVYPGESYPYLNEEKNGWYKIEYQKDKTGWVSETYVDLVE